MTAPGETVLICFCRAGVAPDGETTPMIDNHFNNDGALAFRKEIYLRGRQRYGGGGREGYDRGNASLPRRIRSNIPGA